MQKSLLDMAHDPDESDRKDKLDYIVLFEGVKYNKSSSDEHLSATKLIQHTCLFLF